MRFPKNTVMKRTFQLFDLLELKEGKGGLIPYYLENDKNVCPSYFNDVHQVGKVWEQGLTDPYKINSGLPDDATIPVELLKTDPNQLVEKALKAFTDEARKLFAKHKSQANRDPHEETEFWSLLMKGDNMSVRQFLASHKNDKIPDGPNYNFNTIEWLEGATFGTGWYDQSLTECVLEQLDFHVDSEEGEAFWCIDGGAQELAHRMKSKIKEHVQFNSQVTAINANVPEHKDPNKYVPITLTIKHTDLLTKLSTSRKEDYPAVFNSTTLGALQRMNLKDAGLLWGTKQAIRALGYGALCKVAIKFKTPWWQLPPFNINQGGVSRTDVPLRVCVYPSYSIEELEGEHWDKDGTSVLLCSYTWGQDAQRIGSLISPTSPEGEEQLKAVLLHNLALLHANDAKPYDDLLPFLESQYDTHHAWDWYKDENMSGAFAYFGPGQVPNMWQEIIKPNAFGKLYLIGEAASSHHAWIVGALESVIRVVYMMFENLQSNNIGYRPYFDAMELLRYVPEKGEKELPFFPLPDEIPERQLGTNKDEEQTDNPADTNHILRYGAAVPGLSLTESVFKHISKLELLPRV